MPNPPESRKSSVKPGDTIAANSDTLLEVGRILWRRNFGAYAGRVFGMVSTSFSKSPVSTKPGHQTWDIAECVNRFHALCICSPKRIRLLE